MTDINKTVMDVIIDPNVGNQLMDMFYKDPDYFENTYHNKIAPNVLNRFLDVVSSQGFLVPLLGCCDITLMKIALIILRLRKLKH